jgi:hypothetical protein
VRNPTLFSPYARVKTAEISHLAVLVQGHKGLQNRCTDDHLAMASSHFLQIPIEAVQAF